MLPISIIIPIYNSERTLERCIRAIQKQSFSDFELLLCDDGSTDHSLQICEHFAESDKRIKVCPISHHGVSAARNTGLTNASGRYIVFGDSDDVPKEEWISFLFQQIQDFDLGICGYSCLDGSGNRLYGAEKNDGREISGLRIESGQFLEDLFSNRHMYQGYIWNKIFKRCIIQEYQLHFHEHIFYNEDRLFLFQYLLHCKAVNYSNIPLYDYSVRTEGRKKYSGPFFTEIDAFQIMCAELKKRGLLFAYRYALIDEIRAVSELLSLDQSCSSKDEQRLHELSETLSGQLKAVSEYSYEEFESFLKKHIPFQKNEPDDQKKQELYRDFLNISVRMQAEPMDYLKYQFYELEEIQRTGFITRREYADLCIQYSTEEARRNITDKRLFEKKYSSCLEREVLIDEKQDSRSKYTWMCKSFPSLIYKPVTGGYGKGIRIFCTEDLAACEQAWQDFVGGEGIIEECIRQHPVLASFHPDSVNTIRSLTVISPDGEPVLAAAAIRTGRNRQQIDNGDGGGIFADIDVKTGVITGNGRTHFGGQFLSHPDTGIPFAGTALHCWEEFRSASFHTALIQPELRLCCWDWALTSDGRWALIEGNLSGGIGLHQAASGRGLRKEVYSALGEK